jgi:hypothetical protein
MYQFLLFLVFYRILYLLFVIEPFKCIKKITYGKTHFTVKSSSQSFDLYLQQINPISTNK